MAAPRIVQLIVCAIVSSGTLGLTPGLFFDLSQVKSSPVSSSCAACSARGATRFNGWQCWFILFFEWEAANVLGIPYERVMQAALVPVAYTLGTGFKSARRPGLTEIVHWDRW
ncbi:MAG: hypothetical protein IMW89_21670 [Ktedonobacteraceae bacterium]|nr:hypothetical protein [Ktedonobacteraceae bacterium]